MASYVFTKTSSAAHECSVDDDVIRLRRWGTDTLHTLPEPPVNECTVGAASTCTLQIHDPSGRVSRLHARLVRAQTTWTLLDAGSKNGLWIDGARRREVTLEPGLEIGIGGITLIAESPRSVRLRGFLARLLGWTSDRTEIVDRALRSLRMAAACRAALVLCGEGDLVPIARSIHRHCQGAARPFIVCDPRRQPGMATVRSAENYATGMEALAAAAGGTLCVRSRRPPPDFRELVEALRAPSSSVQLVVCAEAPEDCALHRVIPIVIPPLSTREAEIDHVIKEFADDAIAELGTLRSGFLPEDRAWVRAHACTSLHEIEKATLRLVALRASRTLTDAAGRLGMAPVSLSRWIGRRNMPMEIAP